MRRVLKVLETIFHVRECSIHGVHVGRGLGVKVEGQKLGGRHAEKKRLQEKEKNKNKRPMKTSKKDARTGDEQESDDRGWI